MNIINLIVLLVQTIASPFLNGIYSHFILLHHQIDAIISRKSVNLSSKIQTFHFTLPIVVMILSLFYGTLGLEYVYIGTLTFNWDYALNGEHIFTHQMVPKSVWQTLDAIFMLDTIGAVLVFVVFIFRSEIKKQFELTIEGNVIYLGSKRLPLKISSKIIHIRSTIKPLFQILILILYSFFTGYFMIFMLYVQTHFIINTVALIFWTTVFPYYLLYLFYTMFGVNIYIILVCNYIRILQNNQLKKLANLYKQIQNTKSNNQKKVALNLKWHFYELQNYQLIDLAKTIKQYSSFCAPLLGIIVPYYIAVKLELNSKSKLQK